MPTKKKAKPSAKASSARSKVDAGKLVLTESAIVIALNADDQEKLKRCLAKTGKITFSVKRHSATKLPQILENGKLID